MHNSYETNISKLANMMEGQGLPCHQSLNLDGELHRYGKEGPHDDKDEWYVGYQFDDGNIYCTFGSWGGEQPVNTFRSWTDNSACAPRLNEHSQRIREESTQKQKEVQRESLKKNFNLWNSASPADPSHPYLVRKMVKVYEGVKQEGDLLLIPRFDSTGNFCSLQRVNGGGNKKNAANLPCKSTFFMMGEKENPQVIRFAEGYATAATIHELTGDPVVVCFSCGNIMATTFLVREKYPGTSLILNADVGTDKLCAEWRALYKGVVQIPEGFAEENKGDFNDLYLEKGKDECYTQLQLEQLASNSMRFFMTQEIPEREVIMTTYDYEHEGVDSEKDDVTPVLYKDTSTLLYADGGVGKTTFLYEMAVALNLGQRFLNYSIKKPWRVLYVDAEMHPYTSQQKFKEIFERRGVTEYPEDFQLYNSALAAQQGGRSEPINLLDPYDRILMQKNFENVDIIIFDNYQNLVAEISENNHHGTAAQTFHYWLRHWIQKKGKTFIVASHASRSGDVIGSNRQKGDYHNTIYLSRPKQYPLHGFAVQYEFIKARDVDVQLLHKTHVAHLNPYSKSKYKWRDLSPEYYNRALETEEKKEKSFNKESSCLAYV